MECLITRRRSLIKAACDGAGEHYLGKSASPIFETSAAIFETTWNRSKDVLVEERFVRSSTATGNFPPENVSNNIMLPN